MSILTSHVGDSNDFSESQQAYPKFCSSLRQPCSYNSQFAATTLEQIFFHFIHHCSSYLWKFANPKEQSVPNLEFSTVFLKCLAFHKFLFIVYHKTPLLSMSILISMLLKWEELGLISYCLVNYYQNVKFYYNAGLLTVWGIVYVMALLVNLLVLENLIATYKILYFIKVLYITTIEW